MRLFTSLIFLSFILPITLFGQGLQGKVTNTDGQPLAYATVYVTGIQKGTATNEEGDYVLNLPRGRYQVIYQYIGHKSVQQAIEISSQMLKVNVTLTEEVTDLQTVQISTDNEDPAYTIMRKTIAKAKYHTQQLDEYRAITYIKGTGRLKKLPWLFRKKIEREMKKEGIDTSTAFVSESVSEIHYTRPDQYEEKVISVRKIGEDNNTDPMEFINGSFYESKINGSISPLSPRAFAYYRFEYLGFFADRGFNINKIKVTPRSKGDQVFEGVIYIVDNLWSIHSLNLGTYIWGIRFDINQIYQPIQPNVWLPVNQTFDVTGSFFGFGFDYKYFAHIKDYQITLNPDLTFEPEVIDDKLEKEAAKKLDQSYKEQGTSEIFSSIGDGKDISRKQLRKVLREYEKQELEVMRKDTMEHVTSVKNHEIDSLAYDRDSSYWQTIRPIPLTEYEVKGYHVMDSLAIIVDTTEVDKDTMSISMGTDGVNTRISASKGKFNPLDIIFGGATYNLGSKLRMGFRSLLSSTHFNTVEGFHVTWRPYLFNRSEKIRWRLDPQVRYSFAREKVIANATTSLTWGKKKQRSTLSLFGGTKVTQLNEDKPIDPFINDLSSLLFERNFMKVYEKAGGEIIWHRKIDDRYNLEASFSHYQNRHMTNGTDYVLFGSKKRSYSSNTPVNIELEDTYFEDFKTTAYGVKMEVKPWLKYRMVNNRKSIINGSSPTISVFYGYNKVDLGENNTDYHQVEARYKHQFRVGIRGDLGVDVRAGAFVDADGIPFPNFKHFPGNKTVLNVTDPVGSFRLLDYYRFSTSSKYLEVHGHYQFRKFLLTQLPLVRLTGIRENLFLNWLETKGSDHYVEVGFGINYIFRFLRLEFVSAFQDFKYKESGIRIGLATNFDAIFN